MNTPFYISKNDILNKNDNIFDANFSETFNTERIAAHWIVLPPLQKSSCAHAESLEEEFIYVVSGRPHIWINGYIYQLEPSMCVGFKAGTGISHTVINNTDFDVEMIVLGERSKAENRYIFPINPELKNEHKIFWWENAPPQNYGPHDSKVGNLLYEKQIHELNIIKDVNLLKHELTFTYPEDNETFTCGARLTDVVDLKKLGIWHEIMPPKTRSSWPHAHKIEEELAIILSGNPVLYLNGHRYPLKKGDAVYFKPNTNLDHVIINDTELPAEYLMLGESQLPLGLKDLINYPNHQTRNEQCLENNYFWAQAPVTSNYGLSSAVPNINNLNIEKLTSAKVFLARTHDLLKLTEAEYSLMLGLTLSEAQPNKIEFEYTIIYQNLKIIGALVLTPQNLIITRMAEPVIASVAQYFYENKIRFNGVVGPATSSEAFVKNYTKLSKKNYKLGMGQKIYQCEKVVFPNGITSHHRLAKNEDLDIITNWIYEFETEALPNTPAKKENAILLANKKITANEVYVLCNIKNELVSMNFVGRPTQNGISISAVYTPKNYRNQGYASELVAFTTNEMLKNNKSFCVLYTDSANPTSNKIYQSIGYKYVSSSKYYLIIE